MDEDKILRLSNKIMDLIDEEESIEVIMEALVYVTICAISTWVIDLDHPDQRVLSQYDAARIMFFGRLGITEESLIAIRAAKAERDKENG